MRKTFLKVSLLAVLGLGMSASFTSCKDYDSDIDNLQNQINQMNTKIDEINKLVSSGSVITGVSQGADGGVTFTLSNGQSYTVPAGKPGKDADVWTIEKTANGYFWAKNGTVTEYPAQGPQGEQGPAGPAGPAGDAGSTTTVAGIYYKPEADGFFYKVDPNKPDQAPEKTDIEWRAKNAVTAVAYNDRVVLTGLTDKDGNAMDDITIWRSMFVKSLVVVPDLYLDGIEATRYGAIEGQEVIKTVLAQNNITVAPSFDSTEGAVIAKGQPVDTAKVTDSNGQVYFYQPSIATLDYRINPSNAVLDGMDYSMIVDDKEVVNRSSLVGAEVLGTPVADGKGNITVTYQLDNTDWLAPYDWYDGYYHSDDWSFMALQVKNPQNDSNLVTSDNVLLVKERVILVDLAVAQTPSYAWNWSNYWKQTWDMATTALQVPGSNANDPADHTLSVLSSPADLISAPYNATFNLADHIGIEVNEFTPMIDGDADNQKDNIQNSQAGKSKNRIMSLAEAAERFNLTASYQLVTYTIKPNQTSEDRFAQINAETGVMTPYWVDNQGAQQPIVGTTQGRSAIGRKPMVYVTVTGADGSMVLSGFVRVQWSEPSRVVEPITLNTFKVPYVCNYTNSSTWEQITGAVYEQLGVTAEEFSTYYQVDGTETPANSGIYDAVVYVDVNGTMMTIDQAFRAQNNYPSYKNILSGYDIATLTWDTNENGTHTQALKLAISAAQYQMWYPTFDSNGNHNGYKENGKAKSNKIYAKFYNKSNNTTVYIGFDLTLVGSPAADFTGKLASQWTADLSIAPINPAVPGQTADGPVQTVTGLTYAASMGMNFQSVWNGGFPTLTNVKDPYNITNLKAPYFIKIVEANYSFAATQPSYAGFTISTSYANNPADANSRNRNAQQLFAHIYRNNAWRVEPIAVITPNTTTGAVDNGMNDIIAMLPYYTAGTNLAVTMPTPTTGNTPAKFACEIINSAVYDKDAPAITFDVLMTVKYGVDATTADNVFTEDCRLVIPGTYALKVGVGRPLTLANNDAGQLQDAVTKEILASRLFSINDWQGHALWNVSRTGAVTKNAFNGVNLDEFWFSKAQTGTGTGSVVDTWNEAPAYVEIDLANAKVGENKDGSNLLGKLSEVYVDWTFELVPDNANILTAPDGAAAGYPEQCIEDVMNLDNVKLSWTNNGSSVTKNIYIFIPIKLHYVWGDVTLGNSIVTITPTLQGN